MALWRRRNPQPETVTSERDGTQAAIPAVQLPSESGGRKQRSEAVARSLGVPVNDHLPEIEQEAESTRRDVVEVAERALALMAVAVKGEGHSVAGPEAVRGVVADLIAEFQLDGCFTPAEQAFVDAADPDRRDWVQFSWRYECCWVMHWALGYVAQLGPPTTACDAATTVRLYRERGREGYIAGARLRSQAEILDEADLIYRLHWAVRDAGLNGLSVEGIDPGVVMERHYALNWLIGYGDNDWDDISTDT